MKLTIENVPSDARYNGNKCRGYPATTEGGTAVRVYVLRLWAQGPDGVMLEHQAPEWSTAVVDGGELDLLEMIPVRFWRGTQDNGRLIQLAIMAVVSYTITDAATSELDGALTDVTEGSTIEDPALEVISRAANVFPLRELLS